MAKIFDSEFDITTEGEFFWHATTIKSVFQMIAHDAGGLKPIGDGQLGAGFYVTGSRSDYQKAMARRARENDDAPLFLFCVRVKGFYQLKPALLTSWSTSSAQGADFSAVSWYKEGQGGVDQPERGGFIPSASTGARVDFKYGQYREERMTGTWIADKSPAQRLSFMEELWKYAVTNTRPAYKDVERFGSEAALLPMIGARRIFTRVLLELAFKSQRSLENAAIVGAKVFSPTTGPVQLRFRYGNNNYDLEPAVIDRDELRTDDNPLNFHDEVWIDLDVMKNALTA